MFAYIVRRLLLLVPTLVGIMVINFVVISITPGGPIDRLIAEIRGRGGGVAERLGAGERRETSGGERAGQDQSRSVRGLDPELLAKLKKQLNLDKPLHEQFLLMMRNYITFDFGESFFKGRPVADLVIERMPVSISLGIWTTLLVYLISIPLGIGKAVRDGSRFDVWSSGAVIVGYAVPSFLFGLLLLILFATGALVQWFPLRGIVSDNWSELSFGMKIVDYFWHMVLPVMAMTIGGFAGLTLLTKNSFLDEIRKQYVVTARAKGLTERRVLYRHVFRNAMLLVIAGFPGAFIAILFTSTLLIEFMFSLDGLGLLGFQSLVDRDYPVVFATLYFFSLVGLLTKLVSDLTYVFVDPRIDFESRAA